MTVSKLSLYNGALTLLGERNLASPTENREPRRLLDNIWDGGVVRFCLEQGLWNFAMRTVQIEYDSDVTVSFGPQYAFSKPDDWVRTAAFSADENLNTPLRQYRDEGSYWYADFDTIYVKYVSDDTDYGMDYSKWPMSFAEYVEAHLASKLAPKLTASASKAEDMARLSKKRLLEARSRDAMNEASTSPPMGNWASARMGGYRPDKARGSLT